MSNRRNATYICGPDETPGPRDECPNDLHDWPLPAGYLGATEVAHDRIDRGWTQARCPDCDKLGWVPEGTLTDADVRVPRAGEDTDVCFSCSGSGVYEDFDGELVPCSSCGGSGLDS
jgi:hypothetical protein